MISFTQNLYKTQWLDLVFQNRNKAYGAYELRKHNGDTTFKAFVYASVLLSVLVIIPWLYEQKFKSISSAEIPEPLRALEVNLQARIPQPKPVNPPTAKSPPKTVQLKSIQYSKMVVVPENEAVSNPPSQTQLTEAVISSVSTDGQAGSGLNPVEISEDIPKGTGIAGTAAENTDIYPIDGIEFYPEFPGGQAAFVKYLSRNLRYPESAIDRSVQGKVLISFIIEKDGQLSNIRILRGIGAGCDEEAIRVLQRSPKWKPGMQNKQNVRVAYTLPISFSLP